MFTIWKNKARTAGWYTWMAHISDSVPIVEETKFVNTAIQQFLEKCITASNTVQLSFDDEFSLKIYVCWSFQKGIRILFSTLWVVIVHYGPASKFLVVAWTKSEWIRKSKQKFGKQIRRHACFWLVQKSLFCHLRNFVSWNSISYFRFQRGHSRPKARWCLPGSNCQLQITE